MSEQNSIANIGDLAIPITTFIEKISDATGAIFLPYQIKRVAKANAEANKITAFNEMEIAEATEIQRRTLAWALGEQTKFQENREQILLGTISEIKETAKPQEMENDFIINFFEKAKLVSDTQMQSFWSRILAGEANEPGSFSKRTIETISTLEKIEAQLFTNLCGFSLDYDQEPIPIIYQSSNYGNLIKNYEDKDIKVNSLQHLDTIGLININFVSPYHIKNVPRIFQLSYLGNLLKIDVQNENHNFIIGDVVFTQTGKELAKICRPERNDDFFESLLKFWRQSGYIINTSFE